MRMSAVRCCRSGADQQGGRSGVIEDVGPPGVSVASSIAVSPQSSLTKKLRLPDSFCGREELLGQNSFDEVWRKDASDGFSAARRTSGGR